MSKQVCLLPEDPTELAREIVGASEEDIPATMWSRQLADLVDVLVAHFKRRGWPLEQALQEAREIVLAMQLYVGGQQFYLPSAHRVKVALMHAWLYHEYLQGVPCETLALRYEMTLRHAERIVARQAQLRFRRRQRPLFPELDPTTITR